MTAHTPSLRSGFLQLPSKNAGKALPGDSLCSSLPALLQELSIRCDQAVRESLGRGLKI